MPSFNKRSLQSELLDKPNIPKEDLYRNLKELHQINQLLGGYKVIYQGIRELRLEKNRTYSILDLGSGGGDTLQSIQKKIQKHI